MCHWGARWEEGGNFGSPVSLWVRCGPDCGPLCVRLSFSSHHVWIYPTTNWSILLCLLAFQKQTTTRWMLDHGADPNPDTRADRHPLNVTARNAFVGTVRLLLERGADLKKRITVIHATKRQDNNWKLVIQWHLDYCYDANAPSPCGYRHLGGIYPGSVLRATPPHSSGHIISFLLEDGADPFKESENEYTPAELVLERVYG